MKRFNDVGLCLPEKHYMVDMSAKLNKLLPLIEAGNYFVLNRPRQYGKTTLLHLIERQLEATTTYLPIFISFEGLGSDSVHHESAFVAAFLADLGRVFRFYQQKALLERCVDKQAITNLADLNAWVTELARTATQPLVLMIDEVDKHSNQPLFIDFLAMLRHKYLAAQRGRDVTFHAVILAGLHDVKSLKLKLREEALPQYNSPWNIAVDVALDMDFTSAEIETMLTDYVATTGTSMNSPEIAARLHYHSSGHPFLVSKLCKIMAEQLLTSQSWSTDLIDQAASELLRQRNTNFDSIIKTMENEAELYNLVERVVLLGEQVSYHEYNHATHLGLLHGIFARQTKSVAVHNRIYQELIYNYLTVNLHLKSLPKLDRYNYHENFIRPDGQLDMPRLLHKFQTFMQQEYSQRDQPFLERNGRLIFLAFLKPIINGKGYEFKEPQISEEKRLDVVIVYQQQRYLVELKLWRGQQAHEKGIQQLHDYMQRLGLPQGYLIIFDFTKSGKKRGQQATIPIKQDKILAVWV